MTVLAIGIATMIAFGYRMWWLRRPAGGWGAPPSLRDWIKRAPLALLIIVAVLAWVLPTLAVALAVWLVLERAWRWWQIDADHRRGRVSKHALERPGIEAVKAALIAVAGLAMIAGPDIADGDESLGALGTHARVGLERAARRRLPRRRADRAQSDLLHHRPSHPHTAGVGMRRA